MDLRILRTPVEGLDRTDAPGFLPLLDTRRLWHQLRCSNTHSTEGEFVSSRHSLGQQCAHAVHCFRRVRQRSGNSLSRPLLGTEVELEDFSDNEADELLLAPSEVTHSSESAHKLHFSMSQNADSAPTRASADDERTPLSPPSVDSALSKAHTDPVVWDDGHFVAVEKNLLKFLKWGLNTCSKATSRKHWLC